MPQTFFVSGAADLVYSRLHHVVLILARLRELLFAATGQVQRLMDEPLVQVGLSSAKMQRLVESANATFHAKLPPAVVFECGTIRAIAKHLARVSDLVGSARAPTLVGSVVHCLCVAMRYAFGPLPSNVN